MGNRGKLSAEEWDAFSRRSRPLIRWKPHQIKKLKRAFAKRVRVLARKEAASND